MRSRLKKHFVFILLFLFLASAAVFLLIFSPEEIVDYIGVRNTYLVAFLLAVFGGLSAVTGVSFFASVATFSSGGANPLLLGLFGGLGIFISDSIFFIAAKHGVKAFEGKLKPLTTLLVAKLRGVSLAIILTVVYIYIGFTPLPNDLLMIALALLGLTYKKLFPVLLVGSITVVLVTAYLGNAFLG